MTDPCEKKSKKKNPKTNRKTILQTVKTTTIKRSDYDTHRENFFWHGLPIRNMCIRVEMLNA